MSCIFTQTTAISLNSYTVNIGDAINSSFTINHNLNTEQIVVSVKDNITDLLLYPSIKIVDNNSIFISFSSIPPLTAYNVTIFASISTIKIEAFSDSVLINVIEPPSETININLSSSTENIQVGIDQCAILWGSIQGNIQNQTDLWRYLSAGNGRNDVNSIVISNSGYWGSVYSTVYTNSSNWDNAYNITTNYQNISSIFLQTLSWDTTAYDLSISNGNTVSLVSLSSINVQSMVGATSAVDGEAGLVPKPLSGDNTKYLRGDGTWQEIQVPISNIQYIVGEPVINLDVSLYDTFVIGVTGSTTVTYSNFVAGKSINVYLSALHTSYVPHTFPENTLFAELGDENIIYSFAGYTTRILLQNTGNFIINFSSVVKNFSSEGPTPPYYGSGYGGDNGEGGIGLELLDLF